MCTVAREAAFAIANAASVFLCAAMRTSSDEFAGWGVVVVTANICQRIFGSVY